MPSSRSGKKGSVQPEMLAFDVEAKIVNAVENYLTIVEDGDNPDAPKVHTQTTDAAQWTVSNPLGYIPTSFLAFTAAGVPLEGVYLPGSVIEEFLYDVGEAMQGVLYFK